MLYDRPGLKVSSKMLMLKTKPSVYWVTFVYIVAGSVIYNLLLRLVNFMPMLEVLAEKASKGELATPEELIAVWVNPAVPAWLLVAALTILYALLNVGFSFYGLKVRREEKTSFKDLLSGFEVFFKALAVLILQALIVGVLSIFLVVPGVIAYYRYSMAMYVLYDHPDWSPIQCLRESGRLMRGAKMSYFILQLSFIGWMLFNELMSSASSALFNVALPIVAIFLMPYQQITYAGFYHVLLVRDGQTPPGPASAPS